MKQHYLGIDTGGTFTDFFWFGPDGSQIHKVLSTPEAPEQAILQGIEDLGLTTIMKAGDLLVVHGSTVATNAALEGKGARTAFITNKGFKDLLSLARQNRQELYRLQPDTLVEPVPETLCLEVECRRSAKGEVVTLLTEDALTALTSQLDQLKPEAVAICLLYAYLNSEDENRILSAIPKDIFACCSFQVLPEYREYERAVATWINAWLGPKVKQYLTRLQREIRPSPLGVMQSNGGTMGASQASQRAVNLLLSGPAGGLAAASYIGTRIGCHRLLTFDMGGTSTDVAVLDGGISLTSEGKLGPYPLAIPMVDIHTIGAGGGSLAYTDDAGMLHVGPESAGADPGPACYGRGGRCPTVTDANAVLGRLRPEYFLGGRMRLDVQSAHDVMARLAADLGTNAEAAALGVIALANEHMTRALRLISVQRGYDPREFDLCCFGGAGGLHVCALAEELGTKRILIPANGGVLSAYGMLVAPPQRHLSRTFIQTLANLDREVIERVAAELADLGASQLRSEGIAAHLQTQVSLDCRYAGQSFSLNLQWRGRVADVIDAFHHTHAQRYGHRLPLPVEMVNVRVGVQASRLLEVMPPASTGVVREVTRVSLPELGYTEIWSRSALIIGQEIFGPAIICEEAATTLLAKGWLCRVDEWANLRLMRTEDRG